MGLFSLFRKNKQDSASDQGTFRSRADEQSSVIRSRNSRSTANGSGRAASGRAKAGKDAADPLLPEKKRARRRLIGAVALALAVVIVLPMILDSEPKPLNEDIAIQIPSKDAPVADMTQPGRSDPKQASLDQKEEIVEPASIAPEPASPTPTPTPAPAAAQPETPPVAVTPKVVEKTVEKPVEKHQEKSTEKPTEKSAAKTEHKEEPKREEPKKEAAKPKAPAATDDDAARALAILEGKSGAAAAPAEKKPAAAGGKFVIQVAALATQDKVNELRNKLSAAGIHSYTQKIATQAGDRTRIRVGPFASREEAERMGGRIKKLGLNATIVPA
ncbi:SPOR domain-containing protein [Herbaspirillum rubrisubalbicans]|uniref:SPOR domain-containing protein n=1 Tax=Herbaspirillum rubrisubalbicans TaxID=80842 RepID=A0AAD0XHH2_9BURK|nr:SPOR domain-containing protein [Herbaspirillum rubrisubalbicans]AYR25492.1 SPOR domain-containing protein [Herbaspirillum rubrisubalbicans]